MGRYVTRKIMMQPESQVTELRQLIKDARWAIWAFIIINAFVVLFFLIDGIFNEFVFVALFTKRSIAFFLIKIFYDLFPETLSI